MSDRLADFPVTFHNRQYAPLMVGGMGVNISNDTLALAVEKLCLLYTSPSPRDTR